MNTRNFWTLNFSGIFLTLLNDFDCQGLKQNLLNGIHEQMKNTSVSLSSTFRGWLLVSVL